MDENLYDALEVCLNALETGADLDAVLNLYPHMEVELRPLLEASVQARSLALPSVPGAAMRRGRARVLQHVNTMREAAPRPQKRWSMFAFPRVAVSLAVALVFLLSGTGLVSASNGALPGDNLYPVKRSLEGLRLLLVFSPEGREGLESEFEQERLDEISELLTEGRRETIAFAGLVTAQNSSEWKVSGITVMITSSSRLPVEAVPVGAPVMVIGHTNAQGFVEVDTVEVLGPGVSLPPLEPSIGEGLELEDSPQVEEIESQSIESETENGQQQNRQEIEKEYEFQGVVESMSGNLWTINGQQVNVQSAENKDEVSAGALVEFEGYYSPEGQFIVTWIEVKSGQSFQQEQINDSGKDNGGDDSSSSNSNEDDGDNDHENDDDKPDDHSDD